MAPGWGVRARLGEQTKETPSHTLGHPPPAWVTLLLARSLPGSVAPEGHVTLLLDGIVFSRAVRVTGTHSKGAVGRADAQTPRLRCYYLWFVVVTADLEAFLIQSYICGDRVISGNVSEMVLETQAHVCDRSWRAWQ